MPHRSCARPQGPWEREGPRGSWLTNEPDSLLPQGLLRALQVSFTLVQVVLGLAPVLGQLERGEGCRVGAELPPSQAISRPSATLLPPSGTFPAPCHVALEFGGSRGLPWDAGVPSWWQGPLWDSGAEDSLEQSLSWEGVCCHGGTALHPPCWAWGRGCAYQALADPPACKVSARCTSCSHFRNRPTLQRASWEAWRTAEMPLPPPGARDPVSPTLAGLRACPWPCREDTLAGD